MPVKKNPRSWLVRTGQIWIFWMATALAVVAILLLALMIWCINHPNSETLTRIGIDEFRIGAGFMITGALASILLFFGIRCPSCKRRPVYRIVRTNGFNEWVTALLHLQCCPYCAYPGKAVKKNDSDPGSV